MKSASFVSCCGLILAWFASSGAWAVPQPSVATDRDDIGIGATVMTDDLGFWPAGVYLGTPDEDVALRLLWNKGNGRKTKLRTWTIEGGYWGPAPGFTVNEPTLWDLRYGPKKKEDDRSYDDSSAMLSAPYFLVGGDSNRDLRFQYRSDASFLWNFAHYGDVPVAKGYIGPLFGTGLRVAYPPKDSLDPSPHGGFHLVGGLLAGAVVADWVILNGAGRFLRDPFSGGTTVVEAGALATVDFTPHGAPLAVQFTGQLEHELGSGAALGWTAGVTAIIVREF